MTGLSAGTLFRAYEARRTITWVEIQDNGMTKKWKKSALKQLNIKHKLTEKLEANEKELSELRSELIPRLQEELQDAELALDTAVAFVKMGGEDNGNIAYWTSMAGLRKLKLAHFERLVFDRLVI